MHALLTRPDPEFPRGWTLPRQRLPLAHPGEARQFRVDCRSGGGIVYLLDPAVHPRGPIDDAILCKQVGVGQFIRLWFDGEIASLRVAVPS